MTVELIPAKTYLYALNQNAELRADIERLTAALLQIANLNGISTRLDAQRIANRALEPKP